MKIKIKELFIQKWGKYFPDNELPVACFYSDKKEEVEFSKPPPENKKGYTCIFSQLAPVRRGRARAFNQKNLGCDGAVDMLGFGGIPTKEDIDELADILTNVEKYKKSKEHVIRMAKSNPPISAKGKYLIFKRWDLLAEDDNPQVVLFFVKPDVIGGLHMLANFDTTDPHGVIAPFGVGCDSLIGFAMKEFESESPRAVIGSFDPSARTCLKPNLFSFSIPWPKFVAMVANMDDCFLNTYVWEGIQKRMKPAD